MFFFLYSRNFDTGHREITRLISLFKTKSFSIRNVCGAVGFHAQKYKPVRRTTYRIRVGRWHPTGV